jgi:salicylate hydroxylase
MEQAPELGEAGGGIQVSPNASRVLHALGLEQPLAGRAFHPEGIEGRSWRRGRSLLHIPLGEQVTRRFGAPYYHLHRADLQAVLVDAVADTPGIDVRLGTPCAEILQSRDVVTANTPEMNSFTADLAVGADGIKSSVREGLFGPETPRFTGCVAWRGLVPAELVRDADVRPVASIWMGPGAHVVSYYLRAGRLVNLVAVVERTDWEVESWTERGEKSELLADFEGWHPTVSALLSAVEADSCFKWALFDRDPLPRWSDRRITLLGDACHPTLPFMAQGACMAIEDAAVLGECVADADDVPSALERYEGLRKRRTAGVQRGSRRNAALYHLSGPKAWLRDLSAPVLSSRWASRTDELFAYDPIAAARA